MRIVTTLLLAAALFLPSQPLVHAGEYRDVGPGDRVVLPRDYFFREGYRVQWWYFTGHLVDGSGREFGYELTFFVVGVQTRHFQSKFGLRRIHISHFALSDIAGRRFLYSDRTDSGAFGFAGADTEHLRVWVGADSLAGSPHSMRLQAAGEGQRIDLTLTPSKPPVRNGEEGYARKSEGSPLNASLYFSVTRLTTRGQIQVDDQIFHVTGQSWFDREISSSDLEERQVGWDWFALQLEDGRDLMLYVLRNRDGSIDSYSSGTLVGVDGGARHLAANAFLVKPLRHYTSRKTGARYPAAWEIFVPSEKLRLVVTPLLEDQEFLAPYSTWNYYWEGACRVTGSAAGRAYVEMTGY